MTRVGRALAATAAVVLLAGMVFPLAWMLVSSLRPEAELWDQHALVPDAMVLDHYRSLFADRDFWSPIRNSLVVAATTTAMCLVLGSICAYALARLRFRGKGVLLAGTLAVSMFPQIAIVSPLFLVLRTVGLVDTYPGLVLPYFTFAMPLTIWLLVGTFRQIPPDLEHAAIVDGASRLRALWEIIVPLALPGVVTTGVLTFIYCWNEFLFALSFTTGPERQTVPVAVALFRGQHQVPWGEILAAAVISSLPVVVLVLAFQRRIISGLTSGSVK